MMAFLLLGLSILLSVGRNLLSKSISDIRFGTRSFFLCQSCLFLCGCAATALFGGIPRIAPSPITVGYAALYGSLLILAQWFYTAALSKGNTALCSTVYSLGFMIPTLSGVLLWSESFSLLDGAGILCAAAAVVVSGWKPRADKKSAKAGYFLPLVIAMLASGGLGLTQKLQQKSAFAEQKNAFLLIAFLLAAGVSLLAAGVAPRAGEGRTSPKKPLAAAGVGLFFGCCNLLNTTLAGMLDSAVFFPTLNIGVILLSMISGTVLFKERLRKRELTVFLLGVASILLLHFG